MVTLGHLGVRPEKVDRGHDQVVEVERVGLLEGAVDRACTPRRPCAAQASVARAVASRRVDQLVLEVGHLRDELAGRIPLRIKVKLPDDQLHQPPRVVLVVDGERGLETDVRVLGPQDPHARGVERTHPHDAGLPAHEPGDPILHLACGLVRERDRQDLPRLDLARRQQVGDPVGQHTGLAGSRAGDDQQRRAEVGDGRALRVVEALQQALRTIARKGRRREDLGRRGLGRPVLGGRRGTARLGGRRGVLADRVVAGGVLAERSVAPGSGSARSGTTGTGGNSNRCIARRVYAAGPTRPGTTLRPFSPAPILIAVED